MGANTFWITNQAVLSIMVVNIAVWVANLVTAGDFRLSEFLALEGFSVHTVEDGEKALEACKKAYATDGSGIVGIKIKTDGSIICYLRE